MLDSSVYANLPCQLSEEDLEILQSDKLPERILATTRPGTVARKWRKSSR